jgi:DNA polymerase-3 subunit epsilon
MYAVVDTETTGFGPRFNRVAEIAIVSLDSRGVVTDEWTTLINPGRDLGPTHVHGIAAADAARAPTFEQAHGEITKRLKGKVLVGHNLSFDLGFLCAEFVRCGAHLDYPPDAGICTMELSGQLSSSASRRLADCCRALGIEISSAHEAISDARASAALLSVAIGRGLVPVDCISRAGDVQWPAPTSAAVECVTRGESTRSPEPTFLNRLVNGLPRVKAPANANSYLDVLDQALADRHLSDVEQVELIEVAASLGLSMDAVLTLHRNYVVQLAGVALADGHVSESERRDLVRVAELLGLGASGLDEILAQDLNSVDDETSEQPRIGAATRMLQLRPGDRIAITGSTSTPRRELEERASQLGLDVQKPVVKRTVLVCAADVASQSTKVRAARAKGVPVVSESDFIAMLSDLSSTTPT